VRQVLELYAISTRGASISFRIVAPNFPSDFRDASDLDGLPAALRRQILEALARLPKVGSELLRSRPISLPTDGVVYDPELANCCSCEPERAEAIQYRLMEREAGAQKARLEVKRLELELERRRLLLARGDLAPFTPPALPPPAAALPALPAESVG
jgi:hypothetical protein